MFEEPAIHARSDPKLVACRSLHISCQVKRKAAAAAISSAVHNEDCDKERAEYYKGDVSTKGYEEDYKLRNDCSNSAEIQEGPKPKKAKKRPSGNTFEKRWDTKYQLLLEYIVQHGSTLIPRSGHCYC